MKSEKKIWNVDFYGKRKSPCMAFVIRAETLESAIAQATEWLKKSGEKVSDFKKPKAYEAHEEQA
jgi:Uri superfamily endonuclease